MTPEIRTALQAIYDALMSDPPHGPQKVLLRDDCIYQLDGQKMYYALNLVRDLLNKDTHNAQTPNG